MNFFLDGKESRGPMEQRGIEVELNFDDLDSVQTSISSEKFTFVQEDADLLNGKIQEGIDGGLGITHGVPFSFGIDSDIFFNGFADLTDAEFSCSKVIAKVRENKNIDWLDEYADGFGFDLLFDKGIITSADCTKVPYVLSEIPDYKQAALAAIYAYVIFRDVYDTIYKIQEISADLAGLFNSASAIIKLGFLIIYIGLLLTLMINLVIQIVTNLLSQVRFHLGMSALRHFTAACTYLGLGFSSSLFQNIPTNNELVPAYWSNLYLMPEKTKTGFLRNGTTDQAGFYKGTFKDFILAMQSVFKAKFFIIDNVFYFERKDACNPSEVYQIPDVRRDFHGTNADQLKSNYLVEFLVDGQDLNTINRYNGTNAKNYITHIVSDTTKSQLIKGSERPAIPFALGRRKNQLTEVESIIMTLLVAVDTLVGGIISLINPILKGIGSVVSGINTFIDVINFVPGLSIPYIPVPNLSISKPTFSKSIENRIGMLSLSSDTIGVPKLVLLDGPGWNVKVSTDNETKLSAENLWNKYHYIDSMVPSTNKPTGAQAWTYEIPSMPFCYDDYLKIIGNNKLPARIISPEGNKAKIKSLKWNVWKNTATLRYEEEKLWSNNLTQTLLIDEGK